MGDEDRMMEVEDQVFQKTFYTSYKGEQPVDVVQHENLDTGDCLYTGTVVVAVQDERTGKIMGQQPLSFPIEADTLEEALDKAPGVAQETQEDAIEEFQKRQQQARGQGGGIVTPGKPTPKTERKMRDTSQGKKKGEGGIIDFKGLGED